MTSTDISTVQDLMHAVVDTMGENDMDPRTTPVIVYDAEGVQLEVTKIYEDLGDRAIVIEVGPPILRS